MEATYPPHDYLASHEGLAARFTYPPSIPPVRVLDFRGTLEKDGEYGNPVYKNVEYKVQFCSPAGGPVVIQWMSIAAWRDLVGMPQP